MLSWRSSARLTFFVTPGDTGIHIPLCLHPPAAGGDSSLHRSDLMCLCCSECWTTVGQTNINYVVPSVAFSIWNGKKTFKLIFLMHKQSYYCVRILPIAAISPAWVAFAVLSKRSPCSASGMLMNPSRWLIEDLLNCCRLIVWHFRASGTLNRCLCKCHTLTLWNGVPCGQEPLLLLLLVL